MRYCLSLLTLLALALIGCSPQPPANLEMPDSFEISVRFKAYVGEAMTSSGSEVTRLHFDNGDWSMYEYNLETKKAKAVITGESASLSMQKGIVELCYKLTEIGDYKGIVDLDGQRVWHYHTIDSNNSEALIDAYFLTDVYLPAKLSVTVPKGSHQQTRDQANAIAGMELVPDDADLRTIYEFFDPVVN